MTNDKKLRVVYAIINHEGNFFGNDFLCVDGLGDAVIYDNIKNARTKRTMIAYVFPKLPIPDVVELIITEINVLDETRKKERIEEKRRLRVSEKILRTFN